MAAPSADSASSYVDVDGRPWTDDEPPRLGLLCCLARFERDRLAAAACHRREHEWNGGAGAQVRSIKYERLARLANQSRQSLQEAARTVGAYYRESEIGPEEIHEVLRHTVDRALALVVIASPRVARELSQDLIRAGVEGYSARGRAPVSRAMETLPTPSRRLCSSSTSSSANPAQLTGQNPDGQASTPSSVV